MTYPTGIIIAASIGHDADGAVVTWILGGPDDDDWQLPCGVICPPRKPAPVLYDHAVPVLDELVSRKPRWN